MCREACGSIWIHTASRLLFRLRQMNMWLRRVRTCRPLARLVLRCSQFVAEVGPALVPCILITLAVVL